MRCRNLLHAVCRFDHQRVRLNQVAMATQHPYSPGTQQLLHTTYELIDDGLLVSHQPRQIDRCRGNRHAELLGPFRTNQEVSRGREGLGRYASHVQARATDFGLLDQRHAGTPLGRGNCGHVSARSPSEYRYIGLFVIHGHREFPLARVLPRTFR